MNKAYADFMRCLGGTITLFIVGVLLAVIGNGMGDYSIAFESASAIAFAFGMFGILVMVSLYPTKEEIEQGRTL